MTQKDKNVGKIAELNSLFLTLNDRGQESALVILRALEYAQSVMCPPKETKQAGESHVNCST